MVTRTSASVLSTVIILQTNPTIKRTQTANGDPLQLFQQKSSPLFENSFSFQLPQMHRNRRQRPGIPPQRQIGAAAFVPGPSKPAGGRLHLVPDELLAGKVSASSRLG
jgi:hypothetical protein